MNRTFYDIVNNIMCFLRKMKLKDESYHMYLVIAALYLVTISIIHITDMAYAIFYILI